MKECHWRKKRLLVKYESQISKIILKTSITKTELIKYLSDGELYGFALVSLRPTKLASKFLRINFPPILVKEKLEFNDLPEWMQKVCLKQTFPRTTIAQAMKCDNILLHTELIKFYCQNGFVITDVDCLFEFQGSKCFTDVYDKLYSARVEATREKDSMKASAVKLTGNSMYGQTLMV
mgnify:CR=1 FL=1